MSTTSNTKATTMFETSPWSPGEKVGAPARTVSVEITRDHVQEARWSRFQNPVSIALRGHLQENACAQVFWNSDSFAPGGPGDEARIGIYVADTDPESGRTKEAEYHLPLPRRTARAMWKIRSQGISSFQPMSMRVTLPVQAMTRRGEEGQ